MDQGIVGDVGKEKKSEVEANVDSLSTILYFRENLIKFIFFVLVKEKVDPSCNLLLCFVLFF